MQNDLPNAVKLAASDAQALLYAEALEAHPPKTWTATDSQAASRDALAVAGSDDIPGFLLTRAKLVLSRMGSTAGSLMPPQMPSSAWVMRTLAALVIFCGFFAGAVTDQLTSTGAKLNLLSPPMLAVFIWNILAMLAALAGLVLYFRSGSTARGLSSTLATAVSSAGRLTALVPIGKPEAKTYFQSLLPLYIPQASWRIRTAFHWAALAFGVGLTVSLLVRGIGTAYWATWESTWFSGNPAAIASILQVLYGWLPDFLLGLEALPDASTLAALQTDGSVPSAASLAAGAPWLARMIWAAVGLIIVPRALLAFVSTILANQAAKTLCVPIDPRRIREQLQEAQARPACTWLLNGAHALISAAADQRVLTIDPWTAPDFPELNELQPLPGDRVVLQLDPASTPEEDVHGLLISAVQERCEHLVLRLDFSNLKSRFADSPDRIQSRRGLWEHFAASANVSLEMIGAD